MSSLFLHSIMTRALQESNETSPIIDSLTSTEDDSSTSSSSYSSPDIPPERMAVAIIPLVLVIILGITLQLGNVRTILVAAIRCVIQLVLLGLILTPVFTTNEVYVVLPYVLIMILFATHEASVKPKFRYTGMTWHMLMSILISITCSLFLISFGVLEPNPWWDAQVIIPVGGMMLGSSVSALSLGMDRFLLSLTGGSTSTAAPGKKRNGISATGNGSTGSPLLQTYLACGATRWEAALPSIRQALETGLTPNLNQMSVMGIVSIPGMLTGQILAGTPPWIAAKYQIIIMFFIVCNSIWILFLCIVQAMYATLFDHHSGSYHCFRGDLVWKRSGGKPKDFIMAFLTGVIDMAQWIREVVCGLCFTRKEEAERVSRDTEKEKEKEEDIENDDKNSTSSVFTNAPNGFVRSPAISTLQTSQDGLEKDPLLKLRHGSLAYGDRLLLQDVDVVLHEGEILLLTGASGTGKSSFLRALALLQPLQCGDLLFKGYSAGNSRTETRGQVTPTHWRSQVLYVRQAGGQGLDGTPTDNLDKLCELRSQKSRLPKDRQIIHDRFKSNLKALGLTADMMDISWGNMSGGEAQRVYLCMLLSLQPSVLLLDEPTSACDEQNAKVVEKLIVESGTATIWISHDPTQMHRLQELEQTSLIRIAPILKDSTFSSENTSIEDDLQSSVSIQEQKGGFSLSLADVESL